MKLFFKKSVQHGRIRYLHGNSYEIGAEAQDFINSGIAIPVPFMPDIPYPNEKITYITPYSVTKMYGAEINREVEKCNYEDWICLRDGDTMFLTKDFGHEIYKLTQLYPSAGLIGAKTNNVGGGRLTWHYHNNKVDKSEDIKRHREIAIHRQKIYSGIITECPREVAGFFMLFRKIAWEHVGGFQDGLIQPNYFDANFSFKLMGVGLPIYIAESLYIYHSYRHGIKDPRDTSHLKI